MKPHKAGLSLKFKRIDASVRKAARKPSNKNLQRAMWYARLTRKTNKLP